MGTVWTDGNGYFHEGDQQPGERAATASEVTAWEASKVTLGRVQDECQRRIDAVVTLNQKLNLTGTMVANLLAVAMLGQTATAAQQSDAQLFIQSMQWIAAMKGTCAGLVGNVAFDQDASWPPLSDALVAFGARF